MAGKRLRDPMLTLFKVNRDANRREPFMALSRIPPRAPRRDDLRGVRGESQAGSHASSLSTMFSSIQDTIYGARVIRPKADCLVRARATSRILTAPRELFTCVITARFIFFFFKQKTAYEITR